MLDNVFVRGERCLGRAVFAARCSVIARYPTNDNLYGPAVLWTTFGDPALRIRHRGLTGILERSTVNTQSGLEIRPNPARTVFAVDYSVPVTGWVSLDLYHESGALVRRLESASARRGTFRIWVPCSDLNPGIYFVKLQSGPASHTRRFAVVR